MSTVATAIATPADPPKKRGRGRPPKVKTDEEASAAPPPAKRKRGRPPKAKPTGVATPPVVTVAPPLKIKRGRGRPRKEPIAAGAATATTTTTAAVKAPAKRGRPRKNPAPPPPVEQEPAPMPHKPLKLMRGRGRPRKHPKPEDDVPKVTFVDSWQDMPFNEFSSMVQERFQTFSSDQQEQLVEQLQTILNTKAAAVQEEPATQTEQKESLTPKDEAEFFDAQEEVKV
mmetsp:Transcript_14014/g.29035  ORF Transcript_14014/g.29035 Transcript_14014/m.29035 type:complete len:228 (+) Transcript_14014:165-848(+)